MSNYNTLFIGFGFPVRGREQAATRVFGELVELLSGYQKRGEIQSFTPVFLEPHGGDLGGFFVVVGEGAKLDRIRGAEEFQRAWTRARLIVENLGVVGGFTGDLIQKQMSLFQAQVGDILAK